MFANDITKVYALEPDPAMRKVAQTSLDGLPNAEIIACYAEQIALAPSSIDLIIVGNAFHRFKPMACTELRSILKEQGWIALINYRIINDAFTNMLSAKLEELKGMADRMAKSWHRTPAQELFGKCQTQTLSYRQSHREDWTAFFGAACAGIEAPSPGAREFAQFEAINREVFDAFASQGQIQLEYETAVLFGRPGGG